MSEEFKHYTVMLNEAVEALNCQSGKIYVDATLGGGGHSELILKKIQPSGRLICFDVDVDAIKTSQERLKNYKNVTIIHDSYVNIKKNLQKLGIEKITGGIIFDLGASYHQLTKAERGFSFQKDAPLNMAFDAQQEFNAYDVVNTYTESDLVNIFSQYGEERFSKRIAKAIVMQRKIKKIETTLELASLIVNSVPKTKEKIHPATRVFQAIRIEVNKELRNIKNTLEELVSLLDVGAIISIISFHSLEDRIVKQFFKEYSKTCRCPINQPKCTCSGKEIEVLTKKPIVASEHEIWENPPSRSAKLRVGMKCISGVKIVTNK